MHPQPTLEDLMSALPHVLAAPRTDTVVERLCLRPAHNTREFPERLQLTTAGGVTGDFETAQPWLKLENGQIDPRIQVSLLPSRVLDLVWRNRDSVIHPGDSIIADLNTTQENLPEGTLLQVGTAVLRVSGIWNRGCAKWRARYGVPAYQWTSNPDHEKYRLRGVLCAIERDGVVEVGDRVVKV